MTVTTERRRTSPESVADKPLQQILGEIAVPRNVLEEARYRRDLVLKIAMLHPAARDSYVSGSMAHGTYNKPLEDADCGILINRRNPDFRSFGPESDEKLGPERFIQIFASFILPRLRERGYPNASVNLDGNRAIKLEFNSPVEFDEWGEVDPYVDLIVGLSRNDGRGLWIPNRRTNSWDPGDPQHHTWLMTERDSRDVSIYRARILRLAKRAVKRDDKIDGREVVMCSWNLSALALESIGSTGAFGAGLRDLFLYSASSISASLTDDPSPVVTEPLKLPEGVSRQQTALRLREMAVIVDSAMSQKSEAGARLVLEELFGDEIESIRSHEKKVMLDANRSGDGKVLGAALGLSTALKPTRSDGA